MQRAMLLILIVFIVGCAELDLSPPDQLYKQDKSKEPGSQTATDSEVLEVAAFNVQIFGQSKMDKPIAVEYLPKIVQEFDIVALQEVRDSTGTAVEELKDLVPGYDYVMSDRLGRSTSKEQYAVFYNKKIKVGTPIQYPDPGDRFEREPYIVPFTTDADSFNLIVIHVKPDDAEAEIEALEDVIDYTTSETNIDNFVLMGDFNADCSYYDEDIPTLTKYDEAIKDNEDTTVSNTVCTYDRIYTNIGYIDAEVFNYQTEYGLSQEDALIISDHFPVWISFVP